MIRPAIVPLLVLAGLGLPIVAGAWETLRAAFGVLPALGYTQPGLHGFGALLAVPGLAGSLRLTVATGVGSTLLSLMVALAAAAALHHRVPHRLAGRLLTPFLAVPHAAMAIGLAFVLAPSGLVARAIAPVLGWSNPPDVASVGDPWGLALILGLAVKEVPFLLLVILSALTQVPVQAQLAGGRSLGYSRGAVWLRVILPQLWPMIRLPVLVVLAYGLSVVDMAMILGPSNPPTLSVLALRLYTDPDVARLLPASAAAIGLLALTGAAFAALWAAEGAVRRIGRRWLERGTRGRAADSMLAGGAAVLSMLLGLGALALAVLALWSLAWRWPWPALWPEGLSLRAWTASADRWAGALAASVTLALAASAISLVLAIGWLSAEARAPRLRGLSALVYLPLLLPQIGFLHGLYMLGLRAGLPPGMAAVIWAQVLFVFPYVMIALAGPWRDLDPGLDRAAAALGAGPWRRLLAVRLPVLLAPVLTALAIGVGVSVAQYLPTLFLGAGRIATLTTEAVTLASSSDRRVTAVYATLQAGLPFVAYALAFAVPALLHTNRRGLRPGAPE